MARRHYQLPPFTTLAAFETSARHGSFKNAAKELGVTPGAVSHQIKNLEQDLGISLFNRHHRGVEITKEGKLLFSVLQQSFTEISETLLSIRKPEQKDVVTISATTAFSSLWLTPRLAQLWKSCGDISVNQYVSDTPDPYEHTDLSIIYGEQDNDNPKFQASKLFHDELIPVCSPEFFKQRQDTSLKALACMPLIHLTAKDTRWTKWHTWFKGMGYEGLVSEKIQVNNYMIALQMASDDAGVVLGWKKLLKPLFDTGTLVPLSKYSLPAPSAFYLVSAKANKMTRNTQLVRDCLLDSD